MTLFKAVCDTTSGSINRIGYIKGDDSSNNDSNDNNDKNIDKSDHENNQ